MWLARWILGLLVLLALWIPGARATTFTAEERAALERGEVVRRPLRQSEETRGYLGGTAYVVISQPPQVVWRAMNDVASFPSMFPKTLSVEVISDRGSRKVIRMVQGTSWIAVSYYLLCRIDEAAKKVSWTLVEDQPSDLVDTRGFWQVSPYGEGKSLVTYVILISLGENAALAMFAEAIQNGLLGVPGNLRRWVEGEHGARYREGSATATNR